MKRWVVVIVVIVAVLLVGLPGALGLVAEKQQDQVVALINAGGERVAVERYERGWFSTETRFRYRIEDARLRQLAAALTDETGGGDELIVESRTYHGPVPAIGGGLDRAPLAWADSDSTFILRAPSGAEIPLPGELRSRVQADGSSEFRFLAEAETRRLRDGLNVSVGKTDVLVNVSRAADRYAVDGAIGAFALFDDNDSLTIGPATISGRQQRSTNRLWTGDTAIHIEAISLSGLSARNVSLDTRASETAAQTTYELQMRADDLRGAGLTGSDARIDFFAQRFDPAALARLLELAVAARGGPIAPARRDELVNQLLSTGPEIILRSLKIPMPDADLEADGRIAVQPGMSLTDLGRLARGVEGNTRLVMPRSMVARLREGGTEQVSNVIDLMTRFRFLLLEENRYRLEAEYGDGLLTVNGFPMPLPVF